LTSLGLTHINHINSGFNYMVSTFYLVFFTCFWCFVCGMRNVSH
jgi:hypothetical protein